MPVGTGRCADERDISASWGVGGMGSNAKLKYGGQEAKGFKYSLVKE